MRFCELENVLRNVLFQEIILEDDNGETYIQNNTDELCFETLTYDGYADGMHEFDKRLIEINILVYYYKKHFESDAELNSDLPKNIAKIVKKFLVTHKDTGTGVGKNKGMSFYTIVPYERLPYNEVEVMRFHQFLKYFFNKRKDLFKRVHFCIESGKHKERPNLHAHFLAWFNPGKGKNFARVLKTEWNAFYPEPKYNISYNEKGNRGIHRVPCNTDKIIKDKIDYMTNSLKGSHENFVDLNINEILDFEFSTSQ